MNLINNASHCAVVDKSQTVYKLVPVWRNIIIMSLVHLFALYGLVLLPAAQPPTICFAYLTLVLSTIGVQAGAHRLWAHRSYKANFPFRLLLAIFQTLALQNDIYEWCRDHRGHHKWSDTDADPHNSSRGFFFSHVGWLLVKKHPDVKNKGATLDLRDLKDDPIVRFQRSFYIPLLFLFWFFVPSFIPVYYWNEGWRNAIMICVFLRYCYSLNLTWCVNSWAHIYGNRPYDQAIAPVEATIRHALFGEGFHNYHHTFPWDYSASELGAVDVFNPVTGCINLFSYIGWTWDLKKVNPAVIRKRANATGDSEAQYKRSNKYQEWRNGMVITLAPLAVPLAIHFVFKNIPCTNY